MLEFIDIFIQGSFAFFSVLFFLIAYKSDVFTIKSEKSWDILKMQYSTLYQKYDQDKKHFPNELATMCYQIQQQITGIQWEYIYLIILTDVVLIIFAYFLIDIRIYEFAISLCFGSLITFTSNYFINNVYLGTVIKVPLRTDPLRWGYGNGFFLSMFSIGMLIIGIMTVDLISVYVVHKPIQIPFQIGCFVSLFYRREQQSILGRSIEISCDLLLKENRSTIGIQDYISYNQKMGSIIGYIQADTNLLDLMMILSLYLNLPKLTNINNLTTNYYSVVLLTNFFVQFVISFFISSIQKEDAAMSVVGNTRIQIITASLFSVISVSLLTEYDAQLMGIASFGLITSVLLIVYLEYMTNHSFPQVRNIGSAAINAPMLNVMNANYMGDMGQYFILILIGLVTFISREISGIEGLYALLTGLLMNSLVMMSIQFSGNSLCLGLRIAQIGQIDFSVLDKINLATSNYSLYLKKTTLISLFLISLLIIPQQNIEVISLALGCTIAFLYKGLILKMVLKCIVNCLKDENNLLGTHAEQMWQIGFYLLLQFLILFLNLVLFKDDGLFSYIWGYVLIVLLMGAKASIVGSSLKSIRIYEGIQQSDNVIYVSHLYADVQGMAMEESTSLPQVGYLSSVIVFGMLIEKIKYII